MNNYSAKSVPMSDLAPVIIQTVSSGGTAEITVTGNSMKPFLFDRISKIRLAAATELRRGDVVLYRRNNGAYVLHRIVRYQDDKHITMCGDAQFVLEKGIRSVQILAKAIAFSRTGKWFDSNNVFYRIWWHIHLATRPLRQFLSKGYGYLTRKVKELANK